MYFLPEHLKTGQME
jgi:hypothetical protein